MTAGDRHEYVGCSTCGAKYATDISGGVCPVCDTPDPRSEDVEFTFPPDWVVMECSGSNPAVYIGPCSVAPVKPHESNTVHWIGGENAH